MEEYKTIVTSGLNASTTTQVLIEKSLLDGRSMSSR